MPKRILHSLNLSKIAAVDLPCQEHAVAVIMKSAGVRAAVAAYDALLKGKYSAEDRRDMAGKEAMEDGSYPIKDAADLENAVHAVGRGKNNSHAAIRRHVTARAKALGLSDKLPDTWNEGGKVAKTICDAIRKAGIGLNDPDGDEGAQDFDAVLGEQLLTQAFWDAFYKGTSALQESLCSIMKDDAVATKGPMVTQSLQEFADYIESILPGEIGKTLAAGIAAKFAGSAGTSNGETAMDAVKKALGLPATATEADVLKAMEEKEAKLKAAEKEAKVAKISDAHSAYMNHADAKLPAGGKDKFAEMTADERAAHIKAHPLPDANDEAEKALKSGDAFKTPEGAVVLKSKVGDDVYAILKSQNARLISQAAEIAKSAEEKTAGEYVAKAKELGFAETFAPTLRKAFSGDPEAQVLLSKEIKAMRAQAEAGGVFKEFGGSGGVTAGTAEAELMAKRDELKKAQPALTNEQAFARVYKARENADIVKRFKTEQAQARH